MLSHHDMTTRLTIKVFFILLLLGCESKPASNSDSESSKSKASNSYEKNIISNEDGYPDDTYCAEVQYHNPNTGTQSSYTLTVKVESNELVEIDWPNGGQLNENNFSNAELDEDGHSSFISDKGYDYEVQIIGKSEGCFDNVPMVKQCIGITKSGKRCRHMTDNPNQLCWQHQNQ